MSVVSASAGLVQETQDPIEGLALLLKYACKKWLEFEKSPAKTMPSLMRVPPEVELFSVGDNVFRFSSRKREIWFPLSEDGHNGNRFIISEAVDTATKVSWQLTVDRCRGISHDELVLVRSRRLGGMSSSNHSNWVPGIRVC